MAPGGAFLPKKCPRGPLGPRQGAQGALRGPRGPRAPRGAAVQPLMAVRASAQSSQLAPNPPGMKARWLLSPAALGRALGPGLCHLGPRDFDPGPILFGGSRLGPTLYIHSLALVWFVSKEAS